MSSEIMSLEMDVFLFIVIDSNFISNVYQSCTK